ncbi:Ti-type conjugative transfer relaxase TraA [Acidocella aminolytica]|uniref:Conjugal exonuclease V alpha subunit TraA n=1 Tax=Acidocella aminolytica 101 = DSM 11237 TaxID=1120923 RepID=A0A0D6PIU5_9PROT|nr:Ti-type conjugative transfer relaxase TraA [Acidocella aminolytica]GAN81123.1 conjugal exonuclease V alpha subunit TraA [Acidocella aminolytica 101 = DSM 11237]
MAIYHLSMKPIGRAGGRSAVAAAAYRAAEKLINERDGLTHDFTRRSGVEHAEIVLPEGVNAARALDRSALWNAAEAAEKRKDARVAREIEIALPHELTAAQRVALTREFAQRLADRYGVAVDFAIHSPHGHTDIRNHHAHILLTTRKVAEIGPAGSAGAAVPLGLGEKSELELENRKLEALGLPTTHDQVRDMRLAWEGLANEHLARAGLDMRIDHRAHQERGLEIEPTQHMGVHASQMERRGKAVARVRLDEATARRNAELIREKPEQVLEVITAEKSVFDRHDIARALHRMVDWGGAGGEAGTAGAELFQAALAKVMASPALAVLQAEQVDAAGRVIAQSRYSTRELVAVERAMAESADRMAEGRSFGVSGRHVAAALARHDAAIRRAGLQGLSEEQRQAVAHITGRERIAAVVGLAGAGKSTMLAAAREAWAAQGYRVHGAALAGKAAEGLEESAGIASRTLASWERGWARGFDQLGPKDVLVIDEAGMVGSRQLSRFIQAADAAGAKIVLVGDPEQLQPIGPGAAFRAVAERAGFVELEEIRRQRDGWQRAASVDFGRHRTAEGLAAYAERGAIRFEDTGEAARAAIVRDVTADMAARPEGTRLVLAHRNADVRGLNEAIRAVRQDRGELAGEFVYQTSEGARAFAAGDRVLFRENNRVLGVKNGMLGTVEQVRDGHLTIRLDSAAGPGQGRAVAVSMADYAAVDHGYATTIHKAQGATVDRAYVLASGTMDRHLTYVAMTRHRDGVLLYAGRDEFSDLAALSGRLSRSQAKETTLDYDQAAYAERRGIDARGMRSEIVVPEAARVARQRGMFDGLKLGGGAVRGAVPVPVPVPVHGPVPPAQAQPAETLHQAVARYARAYDDAMRMRAEGLPVLEHQRLALREAGARMDAIRPGAHEDLKNAVEHNPEMARALKNLTGPERAARLVEGIRYEERVRRDPELRAARLVKVWNGLEAEHRSLKGWEHDEARGKVEARMKALVAGLQREPQLESVLRSRQQELGIAPSSWLGRMLRAPSLAQGLERSMDRGRGLSLER